MSKNKNIILDKDVSLSSLKDKKIAIIGYGNQGRSWALNLRDSGINVIVGNPEDEYSHLCREDSFDYVSIKKASELGDIVMILLPDEVTPEIYLNENSPSVRNRCFTLFEFSNSAKVVLRKPAL